MPVWRQLISPTRQLIPSTSPTHAPWATVHFTNTISTVAHLILTHQSHHTEDPRAFDRGSIISGPCLNQQRLKISLPQPTQWRRRPWCSTPITNNSSPRWRICPKRTSSTHLRPRTWTPPVTDKPSFKDCRRPVLRRHKLRRNHRRKRERARRLKTMMSTRTLMMVAPLPSCNESHQARRAVPTGVLLTVDGGDIEETSPAVETALKDGGDITSVGMSTQTRPPQEITIDTATTDRGCDVAEIE